MIKVLVGDIFDSKMETLVNTVNCVGVMGKGIAKEFKSRYPEMFSEYKEMCNQKQVKIGELAIHEINEVFSQRRILNFPTKDHWKSPSKVTDIIEGLDYFINNYQAWNIKSIAFPPLGCGNGGLKWSFVGRIMYQKLEKLPIDIEIYAPFGTPLHQITEDYLMTPIDLKNTDNFNNSLYQIKAGWVPLLECVYQLQKNVYSPKVGRIKFQKIAYILTELGIPTGLEFKQGTYGPFSEDLIHIINSFSNSNLIIEEKIESMLNLIIKDEYVTFREKHLLYLKKYEKQIMKTTALFERIKTTEKAEEVTSIIFMIRKLKEEQEKISDFDVLTGLLEWKKRWDNQDKKNSLINSIKNLAILRWIDISFSEELSCYDIF